MFLNENGPDCILLLQQQESIYVIIIIIIIIILRQTYETDRDLKYGERS